MISRAPINLLGYQITPVDNTTADKPPPYSLFLIEDTNTMINDDSQNPPAYTTRLKSSSSHLTDASSANSIRPRAVTNNEVEILPAPFQQTNV